MDNFFFLDLFTQYNETVTKQNKTKRKKNSSIICINKWASRWAKNNKKKYLLLFFYFFCFLICKHESFTNNNNKTRTKITIKWNRFILPPPEKERKKKKWSIITMLMGFVLKIFVPNTVFFWGGYKQTNKQWPIIIERFSEEKKNNTNLFCRKAFFGLCFIFTWNNLQLLYYFNARWFFFCSVLLNHHFCVTKKI